MEYLIFSLVILFIILIYFIKGFFDNKRKEKEFKEKLRQNFGKFPEKEYQSEQFESISHYFEKHNREGFFIDDITWNDLDMDRIFMLMNHTYSSAGEEYLYYTLRNVKFNKEELEKTEELAAYFAAHEEDRVTLQTEFARLGKTGKFSLFDYLDYLVDLGHRSNNKHYIMNLLFLPAIALIPFATGAGVASLFFLICFNVITYFKDKGEIEPYLISFGYIMRLLRTADVICKLPITQLKECQVELEKNRKQFYKFRKNSGLVMQSSVGISTMNPVELLMDYMRMIFHLDIIKFNSMLQELNTHIKEIDKLISVVGWIETTISIAAFRATLDSYCIPEFTQDKQMVLENVSHPLIENAVANSIETKKGVLLTGSNASGKSTFLKTVAVNAILAQTIYTCTASKYRSGFYRIFSSMSLKDSIESGESYYMVEIKSLKRILDASKEAGKPILCFIDEVLRGTNTVERVSASTQILKSLDGTGILCFAATHDIELTHLLEAEYDNYHFTEEVTDGDVLFSYSLLTGRATTRNAIKLLALIGYDDEIIEKASERANTFLNEGKWK